MGLKPQDCYGWRFLLCFHHSQNSFRGWYWLHCSLRNRISPVVTHTHTTSSKNSDVMMVWSSKTPSLCVRHFTCSCWRNRLHFCLSKTPVYCVQTPLNWIQLRIFAATFLNNLCVFSYILSERMRERKIRKSSLTSEHEPLSLSQCSDVTTHDATKLVLSKALQRDNMIGYNSSFTSDLSLIWQTQIEQEKHAEMIQCLSVWPPESDGNCISTTSEVNRCLRRLRCIFIEHVRT